MTFSLNENLSRSPQRWTAEARRRFESPVIVACHGGTVAGAWVMVPDHGVPLPVDSVAWVLKKCYPDRPVVLVVCNGEGHELHVRGVWYAKRTVWSMPGTDRRVFHGVADEAVGNIWEFEEGK